MEKQKIFIGKQLRNAFSWEQWRKINYLKELNHKRSNDAKDVWAELCQDLGPFCFIAQGIAGFQEFAANLKKRVVSHLPKRPSHK